MFVQVESHSYLFLGFHRAIYHEDLIYYTHKNLTACSNLQQASFNKGDTVMVYNSIFTTLFFSAL